jgi:hypothetical protein
MTHSAYYFGNAVTDAIDHEGYVVGNFMDEGDIRQTECVEIKWGVHPAGDQRATWQGDDETRTTVLVLTHGKFRLDLRTDNYVLEREGDYAMWGPGIGHFWRAEEDSLVISVRWPSSESGDAVGGQDSGDRRDDDAWPSVGR